jgi:hypothetical protein
MGSSTPAGILMAAEQLKASLQSGDAKLVTTGTLAAVTDFVVELAKCQHELEARITALEKGAQSD